MLDFIGDVGGLLEGIKYICMFFIAIIQIFIFNEYMIYLVQRVFRLKVESENIPYFGFNPGGGEILSKIELPICRSYWRRSLKYRFLQIGEDRLESQLDIGKFLVKHNMMWIAFKEYYGAKLLRKIRNHKSLVLDNNAPAPGVNPSESSDFESDPTKNKAPVKS